MPKVRALTDKAKKLWHVPYGYKFNEEGISDWPLDQFTKRRIRDGDIELVDKNPEQQRRAERQAKRTGERRMPSRTEHSSPSS